MKNYKSLFYLHNDESGVFDASVKGVIIKTNPKIRNQGEGALLLFEKGGFVQLNRNKELDELKAFTLEAAINPSTLGERMNIMESQKPSVAFFIDNTGRLVASVHNAAGWQSVDSGAKKIVAGKKQLVRFCRDEDGDVTIEIDGAVVGSKNIAGDITDVGNEAFYIGSGIGGKNYFFQGQLGQVKITKGAVSELDIQNRGRQELILKEKIKSKFELKKVEVILNTDISYGKLQPIQNIMRAVGVQNLSDLDALRFTSKTKIAPNNILIAPSKTNNPTTSVNWSALAKSVASITKDGGQKMVAKYLPNRNSYALLKQAPIATVPIIRPPSVLIFRPMLNDMIRLDTGPLTIQNAALIENLISPKPKDWLPISGAAPIPANAVALPVNTSVIIAGTFDLTNVELEIAPEVETLYIIAEKVVCGANAKITWKRPGGSTPDRKDNPDLNGRGYSGVHTKPDSRDGLDGENGRSGTSGINGANGRKAPNLEIWTKDLSAMPNIDLNGENGIVGGRGQRGGRGGDGADGHVGKRFWFLGWWCSEDPGDGGDGGNGGHGGDGGKGGNGGAGGKITIGVLEGTLTNTVTAQSFKIKNQGGQKGNGGPGGEGGNGGYGGQSGIGETCKDAENGHNGAKGQSGKIGTPGNHLGNDGLDTFLEFSEDAWNDLLTRPWITEADPAYVFPGDTMKIKGSRFTANDRVLIGSASIVPTVNADESLSVIVPLNSAGGKKTVFVRRQDGTESNRLNIWVKPQLAELQNVALNPGATVALIGKAFITGASVIVDGAAIPATVSSATALTFAMPGTGGTGNSEKSIVLQVRNPDGLLSNPRTGYSPEILEIPFQIGVHDFAFPNFAKGTPSWGTYLDTFGALEVWHEQLDPIFGHPILTAAFYGLYHYYLKGEDNGGLATGFCTALSAVALDEFWTGSKNTHTRYVLNEANRRKFTTIHGKLLSRESLIHFHDQGREGNSRVVKTYREIERTFLEGCDRHNAPMLFFIPSGAIWSSGYFDKLGKTHCIVPIRFKYPKGHGGPKADGATDPTGVELYCWDCNHPPESDTGGKEQSKKCRLVFRRVGNEIRFDYYDGENTAKFRSEDGITLGMMTNGQYHLADHDLPFSGPFGLTSFIVDFLLSPADLQITDGDNKRTGLFNNQILAEIPNSRPCYLAKGMYMLPADTALTRKITGNNSGKYTYTSVTPNGTSFVLEGVDTIKGQEDIFSVNADGTQIRFTPGANKNFNLTIARQVENEIRALSVTGLGGGPAADVDITVSPELSLCRFGNKSTQKSIKISAFCINNQTQAYSKLDKGGVALPPNHDLVLGVTNWVDLDMDTATVPF